MDSGYFFIICYFKVKYFLVILINKNKLNFLNLDLYIWRKMKREIFIIKVDKNFNFVNVLIFVGLYFVFCR